MTILFLHGWNSVPGGMKPTYLKNHGHEVINPALPHEDFAEALRIAQAEFDKHQPRVIIGSSRGGAIAMNMNSGDARLILLCPAWKKYGMAKTLKPGSVILHSRADDVVPFADSAELVENSGLPATALIETGNDHRLADPEPLAMMLAACETRALKQRTESVSTNFEERMNLTLQKHQALSAIRAAAYENLFGCKPSAVLPPSALFKNPDEKFLIDIFVYSLETQSGDIEVAVTNGMSDQRMTEADYATEWQRRELIQYFPLCTEPHARRLHDMAWLPLFDGFYLDSHHSIAWEYPAIAGTPWNNAFFLAPLIKSHREFTFEVEGDKASFLWHIPISDEERGFKLEHGAEAFIELMGAVELPWIFDEANRPSLIE